MCAEFSNDLKAGIGAKMPFVFHPFHGHTGDWFWCGKGNCTREEYIA